MSSKAARLARSNVQVSWQDLILGSPGPAVIVSPYADPQMLLFSLEQTPIFWSAKMQVF